MLPSRSATAFPLLALMTALGASPAAVGPAHAAGGKQACFDAYPAAQKLRKAGKLREARAQLVTCSQDACPPAVKKDCNQWLGEVTSELPSVVIAATDPSGADTAAVRVIVDGVVVAERLDGKAIELDPGEHALRFEHAGKVVEQTMVIRQSEKNRTVTATFVPPKPAPAASTSGPSEPAPSSEAPRPTPTAVYVLGGVGIASLALGTYFYFAQKSLHDDLAGRCAPACSPDDVSPLKTKQTIAGVSAGVGVAALLAATVLYVSRGPGEPTSTGFDVIAAPRGAAMSFGGRF